MHLTSGDDRFHSMSIAVTAKRVTVIAFVRHNVATTFTRPPNGSRQMHLLQGGHKVAAIRILPWRYGKRQWPTISIAHHVNLGGQAASTASQRMVYGLFRSPFLPPPEAARVARIDGASIIQVSRSISPSSRSLRWRRSNTTAKVPSSRHWRKRS